MVKDVRINKDLSTKNEDEFVEKPGKPKGFIEFRDKKVPHFITSFAQVSNLLLP